NQLLARQRQLWIGIAAGLLLLAVSLFIIIDQRVKNQKLRFQQQQQEANQEIFNMMLTQKQKIEESKKTEQKRISEELHDGVLGEMNGARMVLLGLNKKSDEQAVAMRSQAIAKLQEVQEEIRTISHELNDAAYQKFHNFIVSIEDLLKSVEGSAPLKISFTFSKEADWDNLNADIKINLYRIVQESLMNCVKHAQAQKVVLDFKALEEALQITITDDGKGFDTRKGKKGIGHKNISSRIKKLNGTWDISSKQGEGTKVSILIPCNTLTPAPQTTSITDGMLHQA
ncbi:MAG TPA: sensor histidine kinase, partial [Eudoraea sp.]|nr:sensor histidine kinase [Eudoraea sp.]